MKTIKYALIIIMILNFKFLYSQQESGVREYNKQAFQKSRIWYDSSTANYQTQYPIILNIPPLNSGMPLDVLVSFLMMDSLLKNTYSVTLDKKLRNWTAMNDTIANAAKFLYTLSDYNPVIFQQYGYTTTDYPRVSNNLVKYSTQKVGENNNDSLSIANFSWYDRYKCVLEDLKNSVINRYNDFVGSDEYKVSFMLRPDYILRIRVNSIDSTSNLNDSDHGYIYKVVAEVIDTIKGKSFNNECPVMASNNKNGNQISSNTNACIKFMYNYDEYYEDFNPLNFKQDQAFNNKGNRFRMKIGQEAIVFLKFNRRYVDYSNDYFELFLDRTSSNLALPIINDKVRDLNHFWNNQDLTDYSIWKNNFNATKSKILNKGY